MTDIFDFTADKKVKSQKVGKNFEKDFKDSVPDDAFYYRFKDGTASWGGNQDNTRFQHQNICDCMLFHRGSLYLLELKSVQGKSFAFSNIRNNQLIELEKASKFIGITAGFVINFRDVEKTVFIEVPEMIRIIETCGKKSFNLQDLEKYRYKEIKSRKLKVHYRYDIDRFINYG